MADPRTPATPDAGLIAFALATYDVALLLVLTGLVVYLRGGLGDALAEIGTVAGMTLFALLLGGTAACLRQVARMHSLIHPRAAELLKSGARWGGVVGVIILGATPVLAVTVAALRELGLP